MRNAESYIWSLIGTIAPQAIYLLATIVLTHILTPEDFGKIGVLAIFISIATTLNDAGLSGSLIKQKEITAIDCSTINMFNIGVSSFLYILLFLFSPLIESFFNTPNLSSIARCLGLVFLINSVSTVPKALMMRRFEFKNLTYISIIAVVCGASFAIVGAIVGAGAYSLVMYQTILSLTTSVLIVRKTHFEFSLKFSKQSFRKLFSFGFFTTCCNIIDSVYENMLSFLFGKFLSISQVGYLTQSKKLEDASVSVGKNTVNSVAFPVLTRIVDEKDVFIYEALLLLRNIVLICLPLFLVVSLFSERIVTLLFGSKWAASGPYLSQLMIAGFFMLLEGVFRNAIKALGNVAKLLVYTFIKRIFAITLIIGIAFLKPDYMVLAYVFGSFIGLCINIDLFAKLVKLSNLMILWKIAKLSIPAILCFMPVIIFRSLGLSETYNILLSIILFCVYYLIVLSFYKINLISFFTTRIIKNKRC